MKFFRGNAEEIKVADAAKEAFDLTQSSLDEMLSGASTSDAFLLSLYDIEKVPYHERIVRAAFPAFYREAINWFPKTGTFEAYIFVIRAIFGEDAEIYFDLSTPGALKISINTESEVLFDFIGRDLDEDGNYEEFKILTHDGDFLEFGVLSGISTDSEVELLFSEMIPMGIIPSLFINYYEFSTFIAEEGSTDPEVITEDGDTILFYEIGA